MIGQYPFPAAAALVLIAGNVQTGVSAELPTVGIVALDAQSAPMKPGEVPKEMRVGSYDGHYQMSSHYVSGDHKFVAGLWASGPGGIRTEGFWRDEYFLVVAGEMSLRASGGRVQTFHTGDSFVIPKGWAGAMLMKTPVRVQYAFYDSAAK